MGESISQASQRGPVILPKMEMCPISQLRPKERPDKRENPLEACTNNEVFAAGGCPHAPVKRALVRLAERHGDHVTGWLHHPDHPLTQQCRVGVLQVAHAQGRHVRRASKLCSRPQGHPPPPPRAASVLCQKLQR